MTRKYKLQRLHKNILLGVSGLALASTIAISGAEVSTSTPTATSTATSTKLELRELKKTERAAINLCKKNALKERQESKLAADKKYNEAVKALKDKRYNDLLAVKSATTTATSTKAINKEKQAKRLAIEKSYQSDLKKLKEIRHTERVKADEVYDSRVCTASSTSIIN